MTRGGSAARWVAGALLFVLLATANGAGYRYGTSDQAFYIPAVVRELQPDTFPRDGTLIDAQARLILTDEVLAAAARVTRLPLDVLFFAAYLLSLVALWTAIVLIGRSTYTSPWLIAALGAAVTLRHQIPRTSANSLEPYFHPRMLAFALGALAVAALLRRRPWPAVILVGVSSLVHVTTAVWFAVLIGIALAIVDSRWRRLAVGLGTVALLVGAWAMTAGPLRPSLTTMDGMWLEAVATKDTLFATSWPVWAWVANLGLSAVLWWAHLRRTAQGRSTPEERALVWGATALAAIFVLTLPLIAARLALPVQLQLSRVFWVVDFLAIVYLLGVVRSERAAKALAAVAIAVAASRGVYIMAIERPERELFAVRLADSEWEDAMRWLKRQPADAHVLADPGHAWRYGTSVRVSAERDVFVEDVKDSAIAIYSRDVAQRYLERMRAIGDFGELTADKTLALAARYDLDYLITENDLPLPLAYRNEVFRVYALGP